MAKKDRIATEKPMLEKFYLHIGEEVIEVDTLEYDEDLTLFGTAGPYKFTMTEDDSRCLVERF